MWRSAPVGQNKMTKGRARKRLAGGRGRSTRPQSRPGIGFCLDNAIPPRTRLGSGRGEGLVDPMGRSHDRAGPCSSTSSKSVCTTRTGKTSALRTGSEGRPGASNDAS